MGDACCEIVPQAEQLPPCPLNGKVGRKVDLQTVKAMLRLPLNFLQSKEYRFCIELDPTLAGPHNGLNFLQSKEYRFCPDPACPTVYYSTDGQQMFTEAHLRERVFQKHPNELDVFVCYCFQQTVGQVYARGKAVAEEIGSGVKAGQCACEIRNPQGSCCLGNVHALLRKAVA